MKISVQDCSLRSHSPKGLGLGLHLPFGSLLYTIVFQTSKLLSMPLLSLGASRTFHTTLEWLRIL